MSWIREPRKSYLHVSTHQTYIGKALYEHALDCATIAAVACMSSSLLKSSLGPNLLALIQVDEGTFDLFDKIFLEYNPHMQLTQALDFVDNFRHGATRYLLEELNDNGPLFSSSLQRINNIPWQCLEGIITASPSSFRALRTVSLYLGDVDDEEDDDEDFVYSIAALRFLPSLSELELGGFPHFPIALLCKDLGD